MGFDELYSSFEREDPDEYPRWRDHGLLVIPYFHVNEHIRFLCKLREVWATFATREDCGFGFGLPFVPAYHEVLASLDSPPEPIGADGPARTATQTPATTSESTDDPREQTPEPWTARVFGTNFQLSQVDQPADRMMALGDRLGVPRALAPWLVIIPSLTCNNVFVVSTSTATLATDLETVSVVGNRLKRDISLHPLSTFKEAFADRIVVCCEDQHAGRSLYVSPAEALFCTIAPDVEILPHGRATDTIRYKERDRVHRALGDEFWSGDPDRLSRVLRLQHAIQREAASPSRRPPDSNSALRLQAEGKLERAAFIYRMRRTAFNHVAGVRKLAPIDVSAHKPVAGPPRGDRNAVKLQSLSSRDIEGLDNASSRRRNRHPLVDGDEVGTPSGAPTAPDAGEADRDGEPVAPVTPDDGADSSYDVPVSLPSWFAGVSGPPTRPPSSLAEDFNEDPFWGWSTSARENILEAKRVLGTIRSFEDSHKIQCRYVVSLVGMALEWELVASFCHALRRRVGVTLPTYFFRRQKKPKVSAAQVETQWHDSSKPRQVELNASHEDDDSLKAPTIGALRVLAENIVVPKQSRDATRFEAWRSDVFGSRSEADEEWMAFLSAWDTLGTLRNAASHASTRVFTSDDATNALDGLTALARNPVMRWLVVLKAKEGLVPDDAMNPAPAFVRDCFGWPHPLVDTTGSPRRSAQAT